MKIEFNEGVESEKHFVFLWPLYSKERELFNNLDVQGKLKMLMKMENVVSFVKYLYKIYQKRKTFFESK